MFEVEQTAIYAKWFASLRDRVAKARIAARILYLGDGNFGDAKSVGDAVYELRLHFGPGYRVYFTRRGERIILLLCGGDKGSQNRDIARAKQIESELE
jgi:putative addiction module killer protein